jgi:Tfp pilus assembly protein PilN
VLRTNLSTRPFYNERAVHAAIGLAALVVLAITVLNVVQVIRLSKHNTQLSSQTNAERAEADRLTREAARIRASVNKEELALIVGAAQEANALIDQRTFSWTAFFNQIEATLPNDVMLTSVRPSVKEGATHVSMIVLARRAEDLDQFMDKLESTGSFEDIVPATQDRTEDGLYRAVVESIYKPGQDDGTPKAAAHPSQAGHQ